ncbi:MAG: DUF3373 family protein [Desulfatitalea sp.]|nr:DUF3373 family protein [Desulfatitalea sp.]
MSGRLLESHQTHGGVAHSLLPVDGHSKLAARGQVWEAYWHQEIFKKTFFVTLGGQYYDYEYSGSGNPLGAPVKISEITSVDAVNAVADKVWVAYLSATLRF